MQKPPQPMLKLLKQRVEMMLLKMILPKKILMMLKSMKLMIKMSEMRMSMMMTIDLRTSEDDYYKCKKIIKHVMNNGLL